MEELGDPKLFVVLNNGGRECERCSFSSWSRIPVGEEEASFYMVHRNSARYTVPGDVGTDPGKIPGSIPGLPVHVP